MNIKIRIKTLLQQLNAGVFEKEEAISLSLLSAIAGESIFLLGAPGVAKSLIARRLKSAFANARSFDYLMSRFSTPDEIFGPVSISKLKQDQYERQTEFYLPGADVVFLDEIWKAGPSIQNALLTVLNEKIYRNGAQEVIVPMKALIAASNELPASGEGLEALWDRFLIRIIIEGVKQHANFNEMVALPASGQSVSIGEALKIKAEEYSSFAKFISEVKVPDYILNVIHVIRMYLQKHNEKEENKNSKIYISDRRWKKIVHLMKTSAFLNERQDVDLLDCFLIIHCIWNEPGQISTVSQIVNEAIQKYGISHDYNLKALNGQVDSLKADVEKETIITEDLRKTEPLLLHNAYYEIIGLKDSYNLIFPNDFNNLENTAKPVSLHYHTNHSINRLGNNGKNFNIKRSINANSLFIDEVEYQIKTTTTGEKKTIVRSPNAQMVKYWDYECKKLKNSILILLKSLEGFKNSSHPHLRTNLFVSPEMAVIVESNINETTKELEKFSLELDKLQHHYQNITPETKIEK